jgi:predicted metalloendopeptidase
MDAPVYFCRLGAVIGHEMTHGFDSGGRNFDSQGNLRNWWTESDAARFGSETQKLIDLGSAYEALPGTFMNGGLTVTENLADIGGITLAHAALMRYLDEHPEENAEIDGFTPEQRCFIAWSQLWAEKRSDASMRAQMEDNHAPGVYRAVSPLQHVDAFYAAFGIERGDPMWLPPEERVDIW